MRTGRFLRPIMVASLGLAVLAPLAASAIEPSGSDIEGCEHKGQIEIRKDHWARISSPGYESSGGDNEIKVFEAPPQQRGWIYVSNGSVVKLSMDGGCRWHNVFSSGQTDAPPGVRTEFTHLSATSRRLWLATQEGAADGAGRPRIYRTGNATPSAGNTTTEAVAPIDVGLPAVGKVVELAASPESDDDLSYSAYALIEEPPNGRRRLFRTKVDGETGLQNVVQQYPQVTWEEVKVPQGFENVDGVVMAPGGWSVWIWSGKTYAMSNGLTVPTGTPAGPSPVEPGSTQLTWATGTADGPITTIDVDRKGVAAVVSASGEGASMDLVKEPGKVLGRSSLPVAPKSVTHGTRANVYAVAGEKATYGYDVRVKRWVNITPKDVAPFSRLRIVRGGMYGSILLGQTPEALFRFDLYPQETFLPPPPPPPDVGDPNKIELPISELEDAVLTPERHVVTVQPGQLADVPVGLGLPPSPSPLDVFFIVDTTMSMAAVIRSLQQGVYKIAEGLEAALDKSSPQQKRKRAKDECPVAFGVGDVKDFNATTTSSTLPAYQVHQKVTCDMQLVKAGTEKLREGGGDNNQFEGQTLALSTAVTGRSRLNPPIGAGQDAGFRAGQNPYKVIVLISDAGFMQGGVWPTIDETVGVLNEHDTKVVGVVALTENNAAAARADMEEVARGTDTMAPRAGVDCDPEMRGVEVRGGSPLVCEVDGGSAPNLVPAIANLLIGVAEQGMVGVDLIDPHKVVTHTIGPTSDLFNLKREALLKFSVAVTCRPEQDGQDLPVTLIGRRKGVPIKRGEILVRCRSIPPPPPEPVPEVFYPEEPVFPVPVIVVPVIVPEMPIPVPQNPAQPPNPNAGLSHEEEQQYQVAGVTQGAAEEQSEDEEVELAMSTIDPSSAAATPFVFGCAAMLTAGAGAAMGYRRRSQRSVRPSYVRSRR